MFGQNPIRTASHGTGDHLDVQSIFYTLQGEGPYVGWPSVFIRLGGCNLACSFCDTEFESFQSMSLDTIMTEASNMTSSLHKANTKPLIVISGGEPFRQPIGPLCERLIEGGYQVQIETNGTLFRDIPEQVQLVCSPKQQGKGYHPVREDVLSQSIALKFLISAHVEGYAEVPELGQKTHYVPVYVQPMDEYDTVRNEANMILAVKVAQEGGYRMSLQTHKILGIE